MSERDPLDVITMAAVAELIRQVRADEREKRDTYWQERMERAWRQLDAAGMESLALRHKLREGEEIAKGMVAQAVREERERIAQAIEALEIRQPWGPSGSDMVDRSDAARIARKDGG